MVKWPPPTDSLVEAIPMSTRLEVGGAPAKPLEWVAESLKGFFSEVLPFSLTYIFPCLFVFLSPDPYGIYCGGLQGANLLGDFIVSGQ